MSATDADWVLVQRVQAGDERAFDALMERYQRPVLNFAYRLIGDAAEAEDVAQEVFVRAYRSIQQTGLHRTTARFSTWLFQIARHAALDALRRRKRHPAEPLAGLKDGGAAVPATGRTADKEVAAREAGEQIAAAVARLPEDQRTAIILAAYENLSYAEIADIMKSSVKSVETRLYRARRFLRAQLSEWLD